MGKGKSALHLREAIPPARYHLQPALADFLLPTPDAVIFVTSKCDEEKYRLTSPLAECRIYPGNPFPVLGSRSPAIPGAEAPPHEGRVS